MKIYGLVYPHLLQLGVTVMVGTFFSLSLLYLYWSSRKPAACLGRNTHHKPLLGSSKKKGHTAVYPIKRVN